MLQENIHPCSLLSKSLVLKTQAATRNCCPTLKPGILLAPAHWEYTAAVGAEIAGISAGDMSTHLEGWHRGTIKQAQGLSGITFPIQNRISR